MSWQPIDICTCVDNKFLGYSIIILSLFIVFWYILICGRWYRAVKISSLEGKKAWMNLIIIFLICASASYFFPFLSLINPKFAHSLRVIFLVLMNVACPLFLYWTTDKKFSLIAKNEFIGEKIIEKVSAENLATYMTDKELSSFVRQLVAVSLERGNVGNIK